MSFTFKIPVKTAELSLDITLQCGQSFRWFKTPMERWRGVIGSDIWTLHQDAQHLHCEVIEGKVPEPDYQENSLNISKTKEAHFVNIINKYFRLDVKLELLYDKWSRVDPNFKEISRNFPGVRILAQDCVENTFSFICSSNNNIQRITMLVERLCQEFGHHLGTVDGSEYYSFPEVSALAEEGSEGKLRVLGFGYRAKYIESSAKLIMEKGGVEWLRKIKELEYEECHSSLTTLTGIGDKVADCICLMSMDHLGAIPVDTHVFQIAARDYMPHLKSCKTVTKKIYKEIGDYFRGLYGAHAGWAHSVLFSADLKKFQANKTGNLKSQPKRQNRCTTKKSENSKGSKLSANFAK